MASDFVRNIKGIRNIDILSPNITTENDLISTSDGEVYVVTKKGYRIITGGEKGDGFKYEDFTDEQLESLKGDTTTVPPKIYTRDEYSQLENKDNNTLYFISEV